MHRRHFLALAGTSALASTLPFTAALAAADPRDALQIWYRLVLELVRHTATYSPPVASRAFAYLGIAGYEALASGGAGKTLAGQVNGLTPVPARVAGAHDEALILHGALSEGVNTFFGNTGPTGQRAIAAMETKLGAKLADGIAEDVVARSLAYGKSVAQHIDAWSRDDGGAVVENMGFPQQWTLEKGPSHWVPTSTIVQQQAPLLPHWGNNRPFAMPASDACPIEPPIPYSEVPGSAFYNEAMEVYQTSKTLTDEQKTIARFWSDDPMLSPTPPGHWVSITLEILKRDQVDMIHSVDALARVGMAVADAVIACWNSKFEYDLIRPVTYIRRLIDPTWETLLITPPFPEYPSGHSVQSGAAAATLTALLGDTLAYDDATHVDDNIPARHFANFNAAAKEAAISRLYGGIHFRAACERGLVQGHAVGEMVNKLTTLA